jgi:hypothetical protein
LHQYTRRALKFTIVIKVGYYCHQCHAKFCSLSFCHGQILGVISAGFDITDGLLIKFFFYIRQIVERKWDFNKTEHQLFIDIKKAYDSERREELYNIIIESSVHMKQAGLIKMCLNETYSKVHIDTHLSDKFPIQNGIK